MNEDKKHEEIETGEQAEEEIGEQVPSIAPGDESSQGTAAEGSEGVPEQ
jgi:hypothetical protein